MYVHSAGAREKGAYNSTSAHHHKHNKLSTHTHTQPAIHTCAHAHTHTHTHTHRVKTTRKENNKLWKNQSNGGLKVHVLLPYLFIYGTLVHWITHLAFGRRQTAIKMSEGGVSGLPTMMHGCNRVLKKCNSYAKLCYIMTHTPTFLWLSQFSVLTVRLWTFWRPHGAICWIFNNTTNNEILIKHEPLACTRAQCAVQKKQQQKKRGKKG